MESWFPLQLTGQPKTDIFDILLDAIVVHSGHLRVSLDVHAQCSS